MRKNILDNGLTTNSCNAIFNVVERLINRKQIAENLNDSLFNDFFDYFKEFVSKQLQKVKVFVKS